MIKKLFKKVVDWFQSTAGILQRLYIIFGFIFLLFLLLLGRLAFMQVLNSKWYKDKINQETTYVVSTAAERGKFYDFKGKELTSNTKKTVVAFTRQTTTTAQDIKEIATKLSGMITLNDATVSDRDKRDYYLTDSDAYKQTVENLPDNKRYDKYGNNLTEAEIYQNAIDSLTEEQVNYDDNQLKIIHIFTQMNGTQAFSTVNLDSESLDESQIAQVTAENMAGISVVTAWERENQDNAFAAVIGTISSEKTGIPAEQADEYLAKGYSLNDRVGTSYLEKGFEDILQGKHSKETIVVDKVGNKIEEKSTPATQSEPGKHLKLTIDIDFQNAVQNIVRSNFVSSGVNYYSPGLYAVAIEPSTGAILAMAGVSHEIGGSVSDDAIGTFNNVYVPGSVVKGATLTAGWENSAIEGDQVLTDHALYGIQSWFGSDEGAMDITAIQALEYSSNTYMVQIALKMIGGDYTFVQAATAESMTKAMTNLRNAYAEYGLGTTTGIELEESTGLLSKDYDMGHILYEAFGQYDSYTTLQLAQYAATVANNGQRMSAHLVEGIYDRDEDGNLGNLSQATEQKVLNEVNITDEEMAIIQQGFYQVVNSSSQYATGKDMRGGATTISGKTGTAETHVNTDYGQVNTYNLNVVAYDANRSIAVGVMFPDSTDPNAKVHQNTARAIIDAYVSGYTR